MTKKKRGHPEIDEILGRPWCYYCERDFDDLKILINHQKAKHFKCDRCGRRLNTAGGLSVHMSQVHKESLTQVDNALPNRAGLEVEIFGMEGIPEEIARQHNERVLTQFHQELVNRQNGGNAAAAGDNPNKKPKVEDKMSLKERLAAHKAAKAAAEANGTDSGSATPVGAGQTQAVAPATMQAGSPSYPQYSQTYAAPPSTTTYGQPQTYAQPPQSAYQPPPVLGHSASPQPGYGQSPIPQIAYAQGSAYAQPPQPSFQQQPIPYPAQPNFPPQAYQQPQFPSQPYIPNGAGPYSGLPGGPPRPFGAGSPVQSFQPFRANSPLSAPNFPQPVRTGSVTLPSAPGLPQRPAVGAPPVKPFQFQQMHQGQIPAHQNHTMQQQQFPSQPTPPGVSKPLNGLPSAPPSEMPSAANIDELISSASKQADENHAAPAAERTVAALIPVPAKNDTTEDKVSKKDKDKGKSTRLVYSDNEISPEEKMARMSKYAFTPAQRTIVA